MEFRLTQEDESFRQEVREFLAKEVPRDWLEKGPSRSQVYTEGSREFDKRLIRKAYERGWTCLTWPEEYGGRNASHITAMILQEEAAYAQVQLQDANTNMIGTIFRLFGTEEQKRKFIPATARGEISWCEGLSEPGAGSDLAGIQTRAAETGDGWIVNGQKIWTSGAHNADWIYMLVRTDPSAEKHSGLSVFVADMRTPGITLRPILDMNGIYRWNETFFDDVKLPKDSLVGDKNQGWDIMWATLTAERVSLLKVMGLATRCFKYLVRFLKDNKPDTLHDPAIRRRLSQLVVEFNVTRGLAYQIAWMEDKGLDCTLQASIYKVMSGDCLQHVTDQAMELLGPYGQLLEDSWRVPLEGRIPAAYLESFGWSLGAGTHEIQRNIIARRGLGLPSERTRVTR